MTAQSTDLSEEMTISFPFSLKGRDMKEKEMTLVSNKQRTNVQKAMK